MSGLLDSTQTWAEFGAEHLDRRLTQALAEMGFERPTLVQSECIPLCLQGKDVLARARTGSGKTLAYAVPVVMKMLEAADKGPVPELGGVILVPTKELVAQVHGVVSQILRFCHDVISVEQLVPGTKYMKSELPNIIVTTPSSLHALLAQRSRKLASSLQMLVADEADLMFSFGYEEDMRRVCKELPSVYQAVLMSATLNSDVEELKGLMLHKPAILKLEEPEAAGNLTHFYLPCKEDDKFLILYALLKINLVQGKTLLFANSLERAYRLKTFLERFSIPSAVLNGELPHNSRQEVINAFNQSMIETLIATDDCLGEEEEHSSSEEEGEGGEEVEEASDDEEEGASDGEEGEEEDEEDEEEEEEIVAPKKAAKKAAVEAPAASKKRKASEEDLRDEEESDDEDDEEEEDDEGIEEGEDANDGEEAAGSDEEIDEDDMSGEEFDMNEDGEMEDEDDEEAPAVQGPAPQGKTVRDTHFSASRGLDLQDVATVINVDMPASTKTYTHRVGRTARGGKSGTALSLCNEENGLILQKLNKKLPEDSLKLLNLQMKDIERFRYRVDDVQRSVSKKAVKAIRVRELQREALLSQKLREHFDQNPEDARALRSSVRVLKQGKSAREHLKTIPAYLMPPSLIKDPVQQALVEGKKPKKGGNQVDPMKKSVGVPAVAKMRTGRKAITREGMLRKEPNHALANWEELPPISRKKIYKMRRGKRIRLASARKEDNSKEARKLRKKFETKLA